MKNLLLILLVLIPVGFLYAARQSPKLPTAAEIAANTRDFDRFYELSRYNLLSQNAAGEKTNPKFEAFQLSVDSITWAYACGWNPVNDGGVNVMTPDRYHPTERKFINAVMDRDGKGMSRVIVAPVLPLMIKPLDDLTSLGSSAYRYLQSH